jgi:hypothetical protein
VKIDSTTQPPPIAPRFFGVLGLVVALIAALENSEVIQDNGH